MILPSKQNIIDCFNNRQGVWSLDIDSSGQLWIKCLSVKHGIRSTIYKEVLFIRPVYNFLLTIRVDIEMQKAFWEWMYDKYYVDKTDFDTAIDIIEGGINVEDLLLKYEIEFLQEIFK